MAMTTTTGITTTMITTTRGKLMMIMLSLAVSKCYSTITQISSGLTDIDTKTVK